MNFQNTIWRWRSVPCSTLFPTCTARPRSPGLWNPGEHVNETLALSRTDFLLQPPFPFVKLATLKQLSEKAARTACIVSACSQVHRLVPRSDPLYVSQLEMMLSTLKIPREQKKQENRQNGKGPHLAYCRSYRTHMAQRNRGSRSGQWSVPVTPNTFRHSYATNMLYAGIPLKLLQSLMGHKSIRSTEVPKKFFTLDVAARHRL